MFKASSPMMARLRFTTKQVGGGFYKGTRSGAMGKFEKTGKYSIDWAKVRTYVAPDDLGDFKLTPFVTQQVEPKRDNYFKYLERDGREVSVVDSMKGRDYLQLWSELNMEETNQHRADKKDTEQAHRLHDAAHPGRQEKSN